MIALYDMVPILVAHSWLHRLGAFLTLWCVDLRLLLEISLAKPEPPSLMVLTWRLFPSLSGRQYSGFWRAGNKKRCSNAQLRSKINKGRQWKCCNLNVWCACSKVWCLHTCLKTPIAKQRRMPSLANVIHSFLSQGRSAFYPCHTLKTIRLKTSASGWLPNSNKQFWGR